MRSPLWTALILGLVHALVDAASAAVVFAEQARGRFSLGEVCVLIIVYNSLAFGLQFPFGLLADRLQTYKAVGVAGLACVLVAVGICPWQAYAAVALVGVGNALFHVGAGAVVLRLSGGRATEPGVFVAPGALGLTAGIWLGTAGFPYRWLIALALAASAIGVVLLPALPSRSVVAAKEGVSRAGLALCVTLLLVSVAIRSLVGGVLGGSWRDTAAMVVALALIAAGSKALGGIVADRLGWRLVPVAALVLLAPLAGAAMVNAPLAGLAMLLIQLSMAVTLAATYVAMPGRPGTAFGLPSLALLLGAVPGFTGLFARYPPAPLLVPAALLSALTLYVGLAFVANHGAAGHGERTAGQDPGTAQEAAVQASNPSTRS